MVPSDILGGWHDFVKIWREKMVTLLYMKEMIDELKVPALTFVICMYMQRKDFFMLLLRPQPSALSQI